MQTNRLSRSWDGGVAEPDTCSIRISATKIDIAGGSKIRDAQRVERFERFPKRCSKLL